MCYWSYRLLQCDTPTHLHSAIRSILILFTADFRNLPLTVVKGYRLKEYADASSTTAYDIDSKIAVGDAVVIGVSLIYGHPILGKVTHIQDNGTVSALTCREFRTSFDAHYHAFEIDCLSKLTQ